MLAFNRLSTAVFIVIVFGFIGRAERGGAALLQDRKPVAVLEFKGVKITEDVNLFKDADRGQYWESKPELLYDSPVGRWELNVVANIASLGVTQQ